MYANLGSRRTAQRDRRKSQQGMDPVEHCHGSPTVGFGAMAVHALGGLVGGIDNEGGSVVECDTHLLAVPLVQCNVVVGSAFDSEDNNKSALVNQDCGVRDFLWAQRVLLSHHIPPESPDSLFMP